MKFILSIISLASMASADMMGGGTMMNTAMVSAASCPSCGDAGPSTNAAALATCPARTTISDEQCGLLITSLSGPVAGCTCYNFCGTEFVGCDAPLTSCTAGYPVNGCTAADVNQALLIPSPAPVAAPNKEGCGVCPPNAVALVPCVKTPFNFENMALSECQCKPNYIVDSGRCVFCNGCPPGSTFNEFIFNRDGCIIDSDQFCYASANVVAPVAPAPLPVPQPVVPPVAPAPLPVPPPIAPPVLTCSPPYTLINGVCLAPPPLTVPIAPPVLTCPPPLIPINGVCACPPPLVSTATGCDCPAGTTFQNGACVVVNTVVQSCQPGQIYNAEFNTCFPAPVPRPAPVPQPVFPAPIPQVVQPVPVPAPIPQVVQPVPVPVSGVLSLPTFPPRGVAVNSDPTGQNIFGGGDDDDDCDGGKGKGKGNSGSSNCGKAKGGKGKGGSSKESIESGLSSDAISIGVVGSLLASVFFAMW